MEYYKPEDAPVIMAVLVVIFNSILFARHRSGLIDDEMQ